MKPYYQDKWVTIYHADCREVLPLLPDNSVDLVLTDPPYPEDKRFNGSFHLIGEVAKLSYAVAKTNSWLVTDFLRSSVNKYIEAWGMKWQYIDMVNAYVVNSMARCRFGFDTFTPSLVFIKDKPKVARVWGNTIKITRTSNAPRFEHPTPKYVEAYRKYIAMLCPKDGLVIDPFCGSATSLVAAKIENIKSIGIEIKEKYCEIAANRCRQDVMELKL